jgi:RHS repeat-associated protein
VDQLLSTDVIDYDETQFIEVPEHLIWTLNDHLGSVRDTYSTTLNNGNAEHISYTTYGLPFEPSNSQVAKHIRQRHAGREFDQETEFYYNRARYYDPVSQRFISPDPWGFAAGDTNLYRYVGNSPTNAVDPSGNVAETVWDVIAIGLDIGAIGVDIYNIATTGNGWGDLAWDVGGLVIDIGATLLPFVPGGAGVAMRATRAAKAAGAVTDAYNSTKFVQYGSKVVGASDFLQGSIRTADYINTGYNYIQAGQGIYQSGESFQNGQYLTGSVQLVGGAFQLGSFSVGAMRNFKGVRPGYAFSDLTGGFLSGKVSRRVEASSSLARRPGGAL